MDHAEWQSLRVGDRPIYKQYEHPEASPFMGVLHTGRYEGKLMWVHHTHDASLWPVQGIGFKNNVERENGLEEARRKFRLRWTENAEHVPPAMAASPPERANYTWLIDYQPVIEKCLLDLVAWVEEGVEPDVTNFELRDGQIILPKTAAARGGIQPIVSVTANGQNRAEGKVGETIELRAFAEVPPGAGSIVRLRWDFDGSGQYPETAVIDGAKSEITTSTSHAFNQPGTYFVTAMAQSHRDGDTETPFRLISNVGAARVIIT